LQNLKFTSNLINLGFKLKRLVVSIAIITLLIVCFLNTTHAAYSPILSSTAKTETTVTLSWTESNDWLFSKYEAFYATSVNGPWTSFWSTTSKGETSTFKGGLSPNTDYYFKIKDSAALVGTTPSNTLQVRTQPSPSLEITSNTETPASLSWLVYNTYSSQVPFWSYTVQMKTAEGSWSTLTTITDRSQNTYTATGLSAGTFYFQIIDKVGSSGQYSSSSNVVTLTIQEPNPFSDIFNSSNGFLWLLIAVLIIALVIVGAVLVLFNRKRNSSNF
jgi:hypothetical protein